MDESSPDSSVRLVFVLGFSVCKDRTIVFASVQQGEEEQSMSAVDIYYAVIFYGHIPLVGDV